ncbi:MAG: hypothetical protein AAF962_18160 [Actinomycetota bacterium]
MTDCSTSTLGVPTVKQSVSPHWYDVFVNPILDGGPRATIHYHPTLNRWCGWLAYSTIDFNADTAADVLQQIVDHHGLRWDINGLNLHAIEKRATNGEVDQ